MQIQANLADLSSRGCPLKQLWTTDHRQTVIKAHVSTYESNVFC